MTYFNNTSAFSGGCYAGDVFAWVYMTSWNGTFNVDQLRDIAVVLSYGHPTLICVNKAQMYAEQHAIPDAKVSFATWYMYVTEQRRGT